MALRLHRFHGGLRLTPNTAQAMATAIQPCALPPRLLLPLLQHGGTLARPCVQPGDRVRHGQTLARMDGERGADVHAPADGVVLAVGAHFSPGLADTPTPHIELEVDARQGPRTRLPAIDWASAPREALLQRIREAGIAGLGGAGFPAAEKLAVARHTLILNGAECEPYIACDDALLREHAARVVAGGRLLARLVGAGRVLLALEDSMDEAAAACAAAISGAPNCGIELVQVPTRYPEGGERQLIQVLTGLEVPRGGLARDLGVLVHNVATAAAVWQAVTEGQVLTRRIVTVSGAGVARPGNYEVCIGTPVAHLIDCAGGYTGDAARVLMGGPMMGQALPHDGVPIGKTSNCILVLGGDELPRTGPQMPCIRCGDCAQVCPARLLPQQLLWAIRAGQTGLADEQGVFDCIECGCCDLVCPSHIPLTGYFRHAKSTLRMQARQAADAAAARDRHQARQQRLGRLEHERVERSAQRQAALSSPDAVAAAIARARARKAGK